MTEPRLAATTPAEMSKTATLRALLALTKPRIIELLLITTVPAMMLAARGWPGTGLVAATVLGGALSAGGANALNCYLDRDIDEVMARTSYRPLPQGRISPAAAVNLGLVLGVAGFAVLATTVNLAAALLATSSLLFYVLVYTWWLKRRSDQNIVIGGAAGAVPVLVGWTAVTGGLAFPAWVLFAVVFYWTPPHFWALALRYRDSYAEAGIPMLPVTRGTEVTTVNIVAYAALTVFASLILIPFGGMGLFYTVAAPILGVWLLAGAWSLHRDPTRSMRFFLRSTYYLALLFGAVGADVLASLG